MDFTPVNAETITKIFSVTAGSVPSGGFIDTVLLDVRQYASYYLRVLPTVTSGPTVQNSLVVQLQWMNDLSSMLVLHQDVCEFWSPQGAGGTGVAFTGTALRMQDVMHGPYMYINVSSLGGDSQTADIFLYGTTRVVPYPSTWQTNGAPNGGIDNVLINILGAAINTGVTIRQPVLFSHGRALSVYAAGAGGLTVDARYGFNLAVMDSDALAANGVLRREAILPKRALLYIISNTSGTNSVYTVRTFTQREVS